jgi:hypothetical protein
MQIIGIWGLREEARETWDHFVSDEVVYFPESGRCDLEVSHSFAEKYFNSDGWIEMHLTCQEQQQREVHFNVIVEVADILSPHANVSWESNVKLSAVGRDGSMFVSPPQFVQLPKEVVPKGIPSVVWLQVVKDRCRCGWEKPEPFFVSRVPLSGDEKTDVALLSAFKDSIPVGMSQAPSQLLQSRAETAHKVADQQWNEFRDQPRTYAEYVQRFFKICVLPDGAVLGGCEPPSDLRFESVQMMLRPAGLHINLRCNVPLGYGHDLSSPIECGTVSAWPLVYAGFAKNTESIPHALFVVPICTDARPGRPSAGGASIKA